MLDTLLLVTSLALTQPDAPAGDRIPSPATTATQALDRQASGVRASLELNTEYAFRGELSDGPGKVGVTRAGAALDLSTSISKQLLLSLQIGAEGSWYNFKDATQIIAGTDKPFGQMVEVFLRPTFIIVQDKTWSYIIGGQVTAAGQTDADVSDSLTYGGFGGVQYAVSDNFRFTVGAGFSTRLEKATTFVPFVGFDWTINDRTSLSSRGPGLRLSHKINDAVTFIFDGQYQSREFRLADDATLPDGVVRDRRILLTAGAVWKAADNFDVTFKAGAVAWQEFEVYNTLGNTQSEVNTSAVPVVSIGVEWKF